MQSKLNKQILSALLLLLAGTVFTTYSQPTRPKGPDSFKPANPPINYNKGPRKLSPADQAIREGNEARDANNYKKAFDSYSKAQQLDPKDPRAAYGLGNVYSDLACADQAVRAYSEALRLDKDFKEASIALAYIYVSKERYNDAEARFRPLLKTTRDASAKIGLAYIAAKRKQYQDAIKQFQLIIDTKSFNDQQRALSYLYLGDIYLEQEKWKDAAVNFRKAIEHDEKLSRAYMKLAQAELFPETSKFNLFVPQEIRVGDRERLANAARTAAEYIRKAMNEHGYNHPEGNLWLAHALLYQFNYSEAEAAIKDYREKVKQLEKDSSVLAANCNLGFNQLHALGHFFSGLLFNQMAMLEKDELKIKEYTAQVIEHARELIKVKQNDPGGYGLLAISYVRLGKCAEAIEQLETELIYQTNDDAKSSAWGLIGTCHEKSGQYQEAIRAFNEALRLRPNSVVTLISIAGIHERNGNLDEAIRLKREALERTPVPTASSFWFLASSYFARARQKNADADYEEAIRLFKRALEVNPSFGPGYLGLGNLYKFYKNGAHADESLANYQQAEKYDPNDASLKYQIGDLFASVMMNYAAAINYFEAAIKLKPDFAEAHWQLGLVHYSRGNSDEAIKHLKRALSLNDKLLQVYLALAYIYERQKNYEEAIKVLRDAGDKMPLEYLPYKELARLYSYQQKTDEAIKYYETAISLMKPAQEFLRDVLRCRVVRLRGKYADAITCVQNIKLTSDADPAQVPYEIGLTHVAGKNKAAALAQYEELKRMKSELAEDLLKVINEMK